MADRRWERPCSLTGCPRPRVKHHHHYRYGHLDTLPCTCAQRDQPGTDMEGDDHVSAHVREWRPEAGGDA